MSQNEELISYLGQRLARAKTEVDNSSKQTGFLRGYAVGMYLTLIAIIDYLTKSKTKQL